MNLVLSNTKKTLLDGFEMTSYLTYVNFGILGSKNKKKHMSPTFCGKYRKTHIHNSAE